MSAALRLSPATESRPFYLAAIAGLACAFVIGKALPLSIDAISAVIEPLCASSAQSGAMQDVVEPIGSHGLPNLAGNPITVRRGFFGPRGLTPAPKPLSPVAP